MTINYSTHLLTKGNKMSPILDTARGRFYRRGDVFTTGKSGITGTITEIMQIITDGARQNLAPHVIIYIPTNKGTK